MKLPLSFLFILATPLSYAAATVPSSPAESIASMLPMLLAFGGIFYFMLIRPQSKRAKQQQELISTLQKGDEIVSTSGILGKIVKINEQFIVINVSGDTHITIQKQMVAASLPKGTLEAV